MSIRRASGESDWFFVHELVRTAREAGELWAYSWRPHQIESEIRAAELWIAEAESGAGRDSRQSSGFCFLRPPGSHWEITLVAVEPSERCRGEFSRMADEIRRGILNDPKRSALSSVVALEVREDNLAARRAYERAGFKVRGRRKGYFHDGQDAILYELG